MLFWCFDETVRFNFKTKSTIWGRFDAGRLIKSHDAFLPLFHLRETEHQLIKLINNVSNLWILTLTLITSCERLTGYLHSMTKTSSSLMLAASISHLHLTRLKEKVQSSFGKQQFYRKWYTWNLQDLGHVWILWANRQWANFSSNY